MQCKVHAGLTADGDSVTAADTMSLLWLVNGLASRTNPLTYRYIIIHCISKPQQIINSTNTHISSVSCKSNKGHQEREMPVWYFYTSDAFPTLAKSVTWTNVLQFRSGTGTGQTLCVLSPSDSSFLCK